MRILSLSNPWPWVMLHPDPDVVKLIENRSWKPPDNAMNQWIALHAAKSWDPVAFEYWERIGVTGFPRDRSEYPAGQIIGCYHLTDVATGSSANVPANVPASQRKWFFGYYGWIGDRSVRLPAPITYKGGQGLRHLPSNVRDEIVTQMITSGAIWERSDVV